MATLPPPQPVLDAVPPAMTMSQPDGSRSKSSIPPPLPDEVDELYFEALRGAGLFSELNDVLLHVLQERVGSKDEDARRLDLIELYYDANGDVSAADRRWSRDRMVLLRADNGATARQVVSALAQTYEALEDTHLERLGGDDGPLVLRSGEHISAVDDDAAAAGDHTVSIRSLVAAFNVLLERCNEQRRLVPLRGDGRREVYVALPMDAAVSLCLASHLDEMSTNELMTLAGW